MNDKHWWDDYGHFRPYKMCPTRPDPREVLHFYLEKQGIGESEQVTYLIDILNLQKSMVYNILRGEGLDMISRCRRLIQVLKIHPPLLGIDARHYPIERHACWWREYKFSFNTDAQGYPIIGEVVAYFRTQRTQIGEDGRVKVWSQENLGDATGFKKETVYRMEHDHNPLILESMSRRALVASALGTGAGDMEPTLFQLFGLDPQAYGVPVPDQESVPEVHFLPKRLTDETLKGYQQQQSAFFEEYLTCHGQDAIGEVLDWLRRLPMLLPLAVTTAQQVHLLALQCRYHGLAVGVARERREREVMTFHGDRAVALAEQAMTLPNPKLGEHALLVKTNELLAAALLWRAGASSDLGEYESSQADIDRALDLLPALQSRQLKVQIIADAGLIHAHLAKGEMDRTRVLSYFNRAAQLNAPSQSQRQSTAPDDNFISCGYIQGIKWSRRLELS